MNKKDTKSNNVAEKPVEIKKQARAMSTNLNNLSSYLGVPVSQFSAAIGEAGGGGGGGGVTEQFVTDAIDSSLVVFSDDVIAPLTTDIQGLATAVDDVATDVATNATAITNLTENKADNVNLTSVVFNTTTSGLSVASANNTTINLIDSINIASATYVRNQNTSFPSSVFAVAGTAPNKVLKFGAYGDRYMAYDFTVRISATVSGSTTTTRTFGVQLVRADNTVIAQQNITRDTTTTQLNRAQIRFSTFTNTDVDPFIVDGAKLNFINNSGTTVTITDINLIIQGRII